MFSRMFNCFVSGELHAALLYNRFKRGRSNKQILRLIPPSSDYAAQFDSKVRHAKMMSSSYRMLKQKPRNHANLMASWLETLFRSAKEIVESLMRSFRQLNKKL